MDRIIEQHKMTKTVRESMMIPAHIERKETTEFRKTKAKLKKDGHYKCWVCDSEEKLQAHHFLCEWSMENICDFNKLKELAELFDIYGYGAEMKDIPMTSTDDIRNMMVICQLHHIQTFTGIHNLTFPTWILQKVSKDNIEVIIDEDRTSTVLVEVEGA